jgi:hypothetical protein
MRACLEEGQAKLYLSIVVILETCSITIPLLSVQYEKFVNWPYFVASHVTDDISRAKVISHTDGLKPGPNPLLTGASIATIIRDLPQSSILIGALLSQAHDSRCGLIREEWPHGRVIIELRESMYDEYSGFDHHMR